MTKKPKSDYAIQAVANALRLLQVFRDEDEIGVAELARRLGLPKNNVFRLLATMEELGFIEQDAARRSATGWGSCAIELGAVVQARAAAARARAAGARSSCSTRRVRRFTSRCATASRSCTSRRAHPRVEIAIAVRTGRRAPIHCTALGKVLLGCSPERRREATTSSRARGSSPRAPRARSTIPTKFFEHLRTVAGPATRSTSASSRKGSAARRRPCTTHRRARLLRSRCLRRVTRDRRKSLIGDARCRGWDRRQSACRASSGTAWSDTAGRPRCLARRGGVAYAGRPRAIGWAGPMDFALSDEQQALQATARRFAKEEVAPVAARHDQTGEFPRALIEKAWELGLCNTVIPEAYGGLGLGSTDACLILEEIAWGCAGVTTSMAANDLALMPIMVAGSPAQQSGVAAPFRRRHRCWPRSACPSRTPARTWPGIRTTRVKDGDDYVLNGTKRWITNGGEADLYTVFAHVRPAKPATRGSPLRRRADARASRSARRKTRWASGRRHPRDLLRGRARAGGATGRRARATASRSR